MREMTRKTSKILMTLSALCLLVACAQEKQFEYLQFSQTRLLVDDLQASRAFYKDTLGLRLDTENDKYVQFTLSEHKTLGLLDPSIMPGMNQPDSEAPIERKDNIALVFAVINVDKTKELLEKKGAVFITDAVDRPAWGFRTAHLRDPDGNIIELIQPIPQQDPQE